MKIISCPICEYETEGLIKDNGKLDKGYIPSHYCFPLNNNTTTEYYKIDNKWIREDE